jgi:peroxiredoxin
MALSVGQTAPDFTLGSTAGSDVTLSSLRGKNVVVFFFPKAFTGTCEKQISGHGQSIKAFQDLNAEVFGISTDQTPAQQAFAKQCSDVTFSLLSDFRHRVVNAFGVARAEGGVPNERATFVIDKAGVVQYAHVESSPGNWSGLDGELAALRKIEGK